MTMVGIDELCEVLNIGERRVNQLVQEGVLKKARGKFDLVRSCTAYIKFLQAAVEQRQTLTGRAANDVVKRERAKLLRAQVQRAERQNLIASGDVVPLAVMRASVASMIVTCRQNLLNMPGRVAAQLEGESRMVIKAKLTQEVYAALAALTVGTNGNGSHPEPMGGDGGEHLTAPGANVAHV